MLQAALPPAPDVQDAVERVYARRELQPPEPGVLDDIREAIDRFWYRVGQLLNGFQGLQESAPSVYYLVLGLLAALGVAIIAYFVYNTFSRLQEKDRPERGALAAGAAGRRPQSAGEWEDEARRAAAAGRYRDAALALYQALLLRLEAAGAVRYDPAKTPGDYRREARAHERAARALAGFLRGFEPVVFGGRTLDAAGYERLRGAAAEGGAHG